MGLRVKSVKDLGKGAWKLPPESIKILENAKEALKNNSNSSNKSTYIAADKLIEHGPQEKLVQAIKRELPNISFEENKKNVIPKKKFEIDIAFVDQKLAVEVDGWAYHGKYLSGFVRDRVKQNLLVCEGWRLLRFTANQIYKKEDKCIEMIKKCLDLE